MIKTPYQILRRPIITEKGLDVKERNRTLCFQVDPNANKIQIRDAVQKIFKAKVASVRTVSLTGKMRRRGKITGYRSNWKKAYVKLKAGEKIPEYAENI